MTASDSHKKKISKRTTSLSCFFLKGLQIASRSCDGLRFSTHLHKERIRMAKGMSPLRLLMRNAPRKTVPDSMDGTSPGLDGPGPSTQARQPLCQIPDTARNPLAPAVEQSVGDSSTPRRKPEQPARARGKSSVHGQEKFPHLENSEGNLNSSNVTPDKNAMTSLASSAAAPFNSKNKLTWQLRQGSAAQNNPRDGPPDLSTPPRPSKQSASSDVGQAAASCGNTSATHQILSNNSRGVGTGGGSVPSTPKTVRATGARVTSESDTGGSQSQNTTPSKSVSRSLKYGQQTSASNSGASGLTSVRPTASQHIITRPMGYLQAIKGVLPQSAYQNFVEQHFDLEEDSRFWRDHNVQVLIRTRPISNSELAAQGLNRCLRQESPHTLSWLGQPESRFTFDHVAGETITQAKLFEVAGLPMVENCMSGYNSCMFAYGQTGSGKTHTMLGDIEDLDRRPSENRGMTPRVFEYLFGRIRTEQESRRQEHLKFLCKCSFLEIYNEQITDLLEPSSTNLQMREDAKKGVYVENLSEVEVQGVQDVIELLLQGAANRKVAATNMNRESSRSHSVFTCVVESKWETNSMTNSRYGRLHLVDLAGSERQKSSGAEGGRLKEAANINKSLSTLGLVIMILVDVANGKQRHVPYRDSKLTFFLQDSLGGNSKTIMIANVSPSSCCAMETLSTLKFAQRAKFIRNNAVINEDASGDVIALRHQIEELKVEVDRLRRESIPRTPSLRFLDLPNSSAAVEESGDKFEGSTVDCTEIGRSSPDSVNASKSRTYSAGNADKKLRSVEAVLAGALRREQMAEDVTKKLAAEVEQLNRLVRQREEDSQCSKMMLRFREEKIRRLEGIADNVLSVDMFYEKESKSLMDELQLIRGRLDRNPELTRFAMENIRLMEQLRRFQEFYECGERDVMLEEIAGLRNQLLDALDTKLGETQSLANLSTPQKRALAPEFAALAQENKLLLIEVESYQTELKDCRSNLNSCLEANADLARQVDELQATLGQLKNERSLEGLKVSCALTYALEESENLRGKIQASEESKELLVSAAEVAHRLQSTEASLAAAQETAASAEETVKQIRVETEELASQQRQSLTGIEDAALIWHKEESALRKQLQEAEDLIQKLLAEEKSIAGSVEIDVNCSSEAGILEKDVPGVVEDEAAGTQGGHNRWEKLQEIELRHSEEIMQLQLELESMDEVLKEERQQRSAAEKKCEDLSCQLGAALLKLEEAQSLVEALEGQQLFSINELENLQSEHRKILERQEENERVLQNQIQDRDNVNDPAVSILEERLRRAKMGREEARQMNKKFQEEKTSRMALEKEKEVTMSEVETQAALAITMLQSEILELREEVSASVESEADAKLQILQLKKEVEVQQKILAQLEEQNGRLSEESVKYEGILSDKDAQLRGLEARWESANTRLLDCLADGDQALTEAAKEMDEIIDDSYARKQGAGTDLEASQLDHGVVEKRKVAESVYHRLQDVQLLARETEGKVRALREATLTLGAQATSKEVDVYNLNSEDIGAIIRESEKKSLAAFLIVGQLLESTENLKAAKHRLAKENEEAYSTAIAKDLESAALQQQFEEVCRQSVELRDNHGHLTRDHDDLRQKYDKVVQEVHSTNEVAESTIRLSERKALASFVILQQVLQKTKELKATTVVLEKEIQEARREIGEKDSEHAALQQQLIEDRYHFAAIVDQLKHLKETNENLQQEHENTLEGKAMSAEEGERMIKLSERRAMAVLIMLEQILGGKKELNAANVRLENEIQASHLALEEKNTELVALEQKLEQGGYQYTEIADRHQLLMDAHERLLADRALSAEDGERMMRLSERKAMGAFLILKNLVDRTKEFKANAKEIEEAHLKLDQKDAVIAALEERVEQDSFEYKEFADRHKLQIETHEVLQQEHESMLAERASCAEDGERMNRISERKSMAAFVMVEQLLGLKGELKGENVRLAKEIEEAHLKLEEKDAVIAALGERLEQESFQYKEIADRHQLHIEAHEVLQQEHERMLAERASCAEDGERMNRISERKSMAAFVMVEQLLGRKKVLKGENVRLVKEIEEAHLKLEEKDAVIAALKEQVEQDSFQYKEIADRHQLHIEAHEVLQQEHEKMLAERASCAEDGERMNRISERKSMAAFVIVEQLLGREEELRGENVRLVKEIQVAHLSLGEKDTALAAMEWQVEQYAEIADQNQLLIGAQENLRHELDRMLAERALCAEDAKRMIRLSERKSMAAFVMLEQLVGSKKELKAANVKLAMEIQEAHLSVIEKATVLAALEQQLGQNAEIADQHQVLMEANKNLLQELERSRIDNALSAEDGERMVRLTERKAMAALVILEQLQGRNNVLTTDNVSVQSELQKALLALTEKDVTVAGLQQEQEHGLYKYTEVADRHKVLTKAHENLQQENERLVQDNVSSAEHGERMIRLSEIKAMVAFIMLEQILDSNQELKAANVRLEKDIHELHSALAEKDTVVGTLHQQLEHDGYQYAESAERYQLLMNAHEKLREEHARLVEDALSVADGERKMELSEKRAVASLMIVQHLTETVKKLKVAESNLVKDIHEGELALLDKKGELAAVQIHLEDNHSRYKEISNGHRLLLEKFENLEEEHAMCLGKTGHLQQHVEFVELELERSHARVKSLEEMLVKAEQQFTLLETKALQILMKALSVHDVAMAGGDRLISFVGKGLDMLMHAVPDVEATIDRFDSVEKELRVGHLKVIHLEKENIVERDLTESLQLQTSRLATALNVKEIELRKAQEERDGTLVALEKETTRSKNWAEEKSFLTAEKEQSRSDSLENEKIVQGLVLEVQTLNSSLNHAELRVAEMVKGIQALTVAKEELELERKKLLNAVHEAETKCSEKEEAVVAIQGELAEVQAKVSEAELRERSLSRQMEEITSSKMQWELERAVVEREIQEMREERKKLQSDMILSCFEVETRETAIFGSLRRSQHALELSEARLTAMDQELARLEASTGNLEDDLVLLDSAASSSIGALEEKGHEHVAMQRLLGCAELQVTEMQTAIGLVTAELVLERTNWGAEKQRLAEARSARETQLCDAINAAEDKLFATEGSLKIAHENVDALGFMKVELDKEIFRLNQDAGISLSKVTEQHEQIDSLREELRALRVECTEADSKISALSELQEQYLRSEGRWTSEQKLLMRRLEEMEMSSKGRNLAFSKEPSHVSEAEGGLSCQCLPMIAPSAEGDKRLEEVHDQLHRERRDNEALRATICQKDMTILSARKEMEIAISNLKEAELEMDKVHRQKEKLIKTHAEKDTLINRNTVALKSADEQLLKREIKIEECEAELQKVAVILSDWDIKMHNLENEWRMDKEDLAKQLTEARLDASQRRSEAALLLQKFQDGQATLKEAEDLVDALVRANENAKHDALDWKNEKESLAIAQGWWKPEREKLISVIARLETDMYTQKQNMWITCKEAGIGLVETMDVLTFANQEISIIREEHQQEIEYLVREMEVLKHDLGKGLKFPVDLKLDLETFLPLCRNQTEQLMVECGHCQLGNQNIQPCDTALSKVPEVKCLASGKVHLQGDEGSGVNDEEMFSMQQEGEVKSVGGVGKANDVVDVEELKHRAKEIELHVEGGKAESVQNWTDVVLQLTSERDCALKDNADLRVDITKLEVNLRMFEESVKSNAEKEHTVNLMHVELGNTTSELAEAAQNLSDVTLELADVQRTAAYFKEELENHTMSINDLEEKLGSARRENAELVENYNVQVLRWDDERDQWGAQMMEQLGKQERLGGQIEETRIAKDAALSENDVLRRCLKDTEHSYAACMSDLLTWKRAFSDEGLVAKQLQMELTGLMEDINDLKDRSVVLLLDQLQANHEELSSTARKTLALRDEVFELKSLSNVVELVGQKQDSGPDLQLDVMHGERIGNQSATGVQLESNRVLLLNHLKQILNKFEMVSFDTPIDNGEEDSVAVLERHLQTLDAEIDQVLLENIDMKCRIQSLGPQLAACHETLLSTLGFCATLASEIPDISLQYEDLGSLDCVGKLNQKFLSDFDRVKDNILNFQQAAKEELQLLKQMTNALEEEMRKLIAEVQDLQSGNSMLEDELDEKRHSIDVLGEELVMAQQRFQMIKIKLQVVESDRDKLQTEVVVLNEQLEMAQTQADEREMVAAEARQVAEQSKSQAEAKEEEAQILGRSVEELESTVYALESQLGIVKREAERQRVQRELLEKEQEAVKHQTTVMQARINSQGAQAVRDSHEEETLKSQLDRITIELRNQQIQARASVESLQQECADKDVQLRSCKAHISELMYGAEKQASENQQKLKTLESMLEQLKVEDRKVNPSGGSVGKAAEKSTTSKVKGSGSPFKCIGSGLAQQRTSEIDEELSAAKRRIKEVEAIAASRQKEVFMLNTKLAEAESMTHDVVRDLLGVKMDIASYATLLNQQQVQRIAERARRRTVEAQEKEEELDTLRDSMKEFIEERESWLEEISRRQAEAVTARVSAEKLRLRDQTLTAENERFQEECLALRKKVADLEEEIKKLSGQQNLQQRIHHHAKIKEENNTFRLQNEDLSGKLRRMEIVFTRVNDELARYRTADGKSAFLNFDEEARLQQKLQETEENRLQLAQNLIGLCTGIMQVAGIQTTCRDLDPSAAMTALQQLKDRQESLEREVSDYKLKVKIAGEKRRLSDLRDFHTPVKMISTNFTASQQLPSPVSSAR